jgi:hypothetical protein
VQPRRATDIGVVRSRAQAAIIFRVGSRGSVRRPSVGPWPRTSELSDRHPYLAMPAEPTIARVGHSGRRRLLRWPTLRTTAVSLE